MSIIGKKPRTLLLDGKDYDYKSIVQTAGALWYLEQYDPGLFSEQLCKHEPPKQNPQLQRYNIVDSKDNLSAEAKAIIDYCYDEKQESVNLKKLTSKPALSAYFKHPQPSELDELQDYYEKLRKINLRMKEIMVECGISSSFYNSPLNGPEKTSSTIPMNGGFAIRLDRFALPAGFLTPLGFYRMGFNFRKQTPIEVQAKRANEKISKEFGLEIVTAAPGKDYGTLCVVGKDADGNALRRPLLASIHKDHAKCHSFWRMEPAAFNQLWRDICR